MTIKFLPHLTDPLKAKFEHQTDKYFVWTKQLSPDEQATHDDQFISQVNRVGTVIALENKALLGGCQLFLRTIPFSESPLHLGGIGGIWVEAAHRRQGIATKILRVSLTSLKSLQADVAYLCTDINKLSALYTSVGFKHLSQGHTYKGKSGKRYTEYDGMLAPLTNIHIFNQILSTPKPFDIGHGNW